MGTLKAIKHALLLYSFCFLCLPLFITFSHSHPTKDASVNDLIEKMRNVNKDIREDAIKALVQKGQLAIEALIEALQDNNPMVRKNAAWALGEIRDTLAVEPLISKLPDKAHEVREYAAGALGKIKDNRAVEPLSNTLKDKNLDVRLTVIASLGEIKDTSAVLPLIESLQDTITNVRRYAAEALGIIQDNRAVKSLIVALEDKYISVGAMAAWALGEIKDTCATQPLIRVLMERHYVDIDPLEDMNRNRKEKMIEWVNRLVHKQVKAVEALGKIGNARAIEPLIKVLETPLPGISKDSEWKDIRIAAAEALAAIGQPSIEYLSRALRDQNVWVRKYASDALSKMGQQPSNP